MMVCVHKVSFPNKHILFFFEKDIKLVFLMQFINPWYYQYIERCEVSIWFSSRKSNYFTDFRFHLRPPSSYAWYLIPVEIVLYRRVLRTWKEACRHASVNNRKERNNIKVWSYLPVIIVASSASVLALWIVLSVYYLLFV